MTIGLTAVVCATEQAPADVPNAAGNPYKAIVSRNVFSLRPPPPPQPEQTQVATPPPKVQLVGIAEMFGVKKAVLKPLEAAKPGQPAQDTTMVLSEGEAQQGIEVKSIDQNGGTVTILNHGSAVTLNFKDDGVKLAAGGAPNPGIPAPGAPGVAAFPSAPGFVAPTPTFQSSVKQAMIASPAVGSGFAQASGTPASPAYGSSGLVGAGGDATPIPSRPVRTTETTLTPEQTWVLIEAQREAFKDQVSKGIMPPLPPTPVTPAEMMPVSNPSDGATTPSPGLPLPGKR